MSYLEWVLLLIALFNAILPSPLNPPEHGSILDVLIVVGFASVGLIPRQTHWMHPVLLTALEFGLLWLPVIVDEPISLSPALYVIVVIRSCLMCRLRGRLLTSGITLVSFVLMLWVDLQTLPMKPQQFDPGQVQYILFAASLNITITFALALLFILLLISALLAERQSREELAIAHEQLQHYALQIESQATLQERNRIAREIHDSLGHSLTAQIIQLENVLLFWQSDAAQAKTFLLEAKRLSSVALQEVRQAIAALRADPLRGKSPEMAIAYLLKQFHQTTGIMPNCVVENLSRLPAELGSSIYRILQEALTNVAKHSAASQVVILLQIKADVFRLMVEDNGKGFDPYQNSSGFGLQGMRERTSALGGQFTALSEPGRGCRVTAVIPLPRVSHDSSVVSRRSTPHSSRIKKLTQRQLRFAGRGRRRKWATGDRPG